MINFDFLQEEHEDVKRKEGRQKDGVSLKIQKKNVFFLFLLKM